MRRLPDPANVDALIAKIGAVLHTTVMDEPVHLVGVPAA